MFLLLVVFLAAANAATVDHDALLQETLAKMANMEKTLESLTRQVMLQQLFIEEKIRTDGDSGLKSVRQTTAGTKPYFTQSFTPNIAAIHEHANYDRTVGMGELNVVMNGVDFRTRHNDYKLRMPSKTSSHYELLEDIPFPDVPPQVSHKHTVQEQITEMREWFKAWHQQNHRVRDYRHYFRPVLCYLEGAWTTDTKTLHEPFDSDRHFIDASSWFDLQDKVRFTSYTGSKSTLENFAYLPTKIMNINNGTGEYAQWNYRIACHPIQEDLPLNVLRPVDDVKVRVQRRQTLDQYLASRAARFYLADRLHNFHDRSYRGGLLDTLMHEIPGKDNYIGNITDNAFGETAFDIKSRQTNIPLNTAYYHRFYKLSSKDAMGVKYHKRGFNDRQLFVAETKQPRVAPMTVEGCHKVRQQVTTHHHTHYVYHKECHMYSQRVSYAIPLEIIYLTPLYKWNPYNLEHKGRPHTALGRTVTAGGRNGGLTADKALNGTNSKFFYFTPAEFFGNGGVQGSAADTAKGVAGILDRDGNVTKVMASGTRIFLPNIPGLGSLRTRYPIMPVHAEGGAIFKELKALEDAVMHSHTFNHLFTQTLSSSQNAVQPQHDVIFHMGTTVHDPPGLHTHEVHVHHKDYEALIQGHDLSVVSEVSIGHNHELLISFNTTQKKFFIETCDSVPHCWDGHDNSLTLHD